MVRKNKMFFGRGVRQPIYEINKQRSKKGNKSDSEGKSSSRRVRLKKLNKLRGVITSLANGAQVITGC
jgi:hypothetical protein